MKKKFKLLISNKIRLIIFIALIVVTIIPTYVIPKVKWDNANILERGVVCVRGTSMEPTIKDNTVMYVDDIGTIHIKWDNGSTLGAAYPEDRITKI